MATRFTRRRALLLLVLSCVLLITLDQRDSGAINGVRTGFSYVFRPFKGMARAVTRPVRNAWRGITNYDSLEKENLLLRNEIARQAGNAAAAEAFVREHNELLTLEQLPTGPGLEHVTAQVIGGSPRDDQQTVEINQGSRRGIRVGMPVVNGAGLIGKVTEVFPDGAVVRLITDPQYVLAVKVSCSAEVPGVVDDPDSTTPTGIEVGGTDPRFTVPTTTIFDPFASEFFTDGVTGSGTVVTLPPLTTTTTTTTTLPPIDPDDTVVDTSTTFPGESTTTTTTPPRCDREAGSIRGRGGDRNPVVGLLNDDVRAREITLGDPVISAGGKESLAPQDLPIGRVSRIIERRGTSPEVEVELNADLDRLNFVSILLYLPASEVNP